MQNSDFKIEGWFPPIKFTSVVDGKTYAVCGSNWIEVPESMTSSDILDGWVCTAKNLEKPVVYKRTTKAQLHNNQPKEKSLTPSELMKKLLSIRKNSTILK